MKTMKPWTYSGSLSSEPSDRELRHRLIARHAAAEGMVLLQNDGVLPLKKGSRLAIYGGGAGYPIKGGSGSGSVNNRDNVSITEGLRNAGLELTSEAWLKDYDARYQVAREDWIRHIYEVSIPGDFSSLYMAHVRNPLRMPEGLPINSTDTDTALYVISRTSGEAADRKLVKGDYYLSETEEKELAAVFEHYQKVIIILNVGGVIDTSFTEKYPVSALVLMSQAGMEGGNALADILTGAVTPSGRLTDTWAREYKDYPCSDTFSYLNGNIIEEKYSEGIYVGYRYFDSFGVTPKYPFGYGLSYTTFTTEPVSSELKKGFLKAKVKVTNTGSVSGKEIVFFFASCPQGLLQKEQKRLIGFEKTGLLQPGESCELETTIDLHLLESYHTAHSTYYMEAGDYYILIGKNAADCQPLVLLRLSETHAMQQLDEICPLFDALKEFSTDTAYRDKWRADFAERFINTDVLTLDTYLSPYEEISSEDDEIKKQAREIRKKLTLQEKAFLCCGKQNSMEGEFVGNASTQVPGAAGETTDRLIKYGISNIAMADGPAGLRLLQCYKVNPADGSIYRMNPYQNLQNRLFGTEFDFGESIRYYQFCTAIPVGTLLAQSFDLKLLKEVGAMIGRELQEFNLTLWLAPGMNIHRNPLCGRNFEYYSEDPVVSGRIAAAITEGVQTNRGVGTTIKHYACNNQEDNRRGMNSIVSERALREIYLKGFEIAVRESQPAAIMTSYNKVNSIHTANNKYLCTTVARKEWGFKGIIMTDWTTTNNNGGSSAAKCISAGNDLVMPGNLHDIQEIIDAIERTGSQKLAMEDLDACVDRLLEMVLRSNRYDSDPHTHE